MAWYTCELLNGWTRKTKFNESFWEAKISALTLRIKDFSSPQRNSKKYRQTLFFYPYDNLSKSLIATTNHFESWNLTTCSPYAHTCPCELILNSSPLTLKLENGSSRYQMVCCFMNNFDFPWRKIIMRAIHETMVLIMKWLLTQKMVNI